MGVARNHQNCAGVVKLIRVIHENGRPNINTGRSFSSAKAASNEKPACENWLFPWLKQRQTKKKKQLERMRLSPKIDIFFYGTPFFANENGRS